MTNLARKHGQFGASRDVPVKVQMSLMVRLVICYYTFLFSLIGNTSLLVSFIILSQLIIHGLACRFANRNGEVLERLLGVIHVVDTRSPSLKASLDIMLVKHNLSMSTLRGKE
jgi:hypothetical protein